MKTHIMLVLIFAGMLVSPGCATYWTVTDYGRKDEKFRFGSYTNSAYGNTTKIYAQGYVYTYHRAIPTKSESYPAYMVVELHEGKIISSNKPVIGSIPLSTLNYPEIKILNPTNFVESGQDIIHCWGRFFIKNPHDINKPYEITIDYKDEYRPTSSKICYPFVFTGAVVIDVITSPIQLLGYYIFKDAQISFWHP